MEIATSARVVCRSRPQVAALPHVCDFIASCLAPPKSWTIETAIRHGCDRLVRHLLDELADNPSLHYLVKRLRARRYLFIAASVGDIALMEHLVERFGCRANGATFKYTVKSGQLEALQWLYDRALTGFISSIGIDAVTKKFLPHDCMCEAGRIGHLEMLQWLHKVTKPVSLRQVLREAAGNGDLRILEWVLPMMKFEMSDSTKLSLTEAVSRSGSLEVAEFLRSEGLLPLSSDLMDAVACNGRLELLQWMYDNGGAGCTSRALDGAASNGHLDMVQWLHSKRVDFSASAMHGAIENGHLAVAKFLYKNLVETANTHNDDHTDEDQHLLDRQPTTVSIGKVASKGGFEMLKWLQINRLEVACTVNAMNVAAAYGHLEVVQFLHENRSEGCTVKAMDQAAENDHLEIVRFLHENRTEGCSTSAMDQASRNGHLDTVTWLHFNRTEGCTVFAMDQAAGNGHLEIVKFLHENRTEGCTVSAMDRAAANGHLDVVEFLHENRSEGCTVNAMNRAAENGHLDVVKFLHKNRTEGCTTDAMDRARNLEMLRWLGENRREGFTNHAIHISILHGGLEKLIWLHDHAPAEMWTPMLMKRIRDMPPGGQIEILEWLSTTFPALGER